MMKDKIRNLIKEALNNLKIPASTQGREESDFILEHPEDLKNGDYTTNIALVLANKSKENPKELAEKITYEMLRLNLDVKGTEIKNIEAAGAGFINFHLSQKFFSDTIEKILNSGENVGKNDELSGKIIMIEYTDPNPFKPIHIGHLMNNAIGESIARILEHSGAKVSRANYQGDVGLHVAKAMHILLKNPEAYVIRNESVGDQAIFIGKAYSEGSEAYERDSQAKAEIDEINEKIYNKTDEKINEIYEWGFKVTMEAFEDLYKILGTKFDFYFLESNMAAVGEKLVYNNIGKVFHKSDGAIVFKGGDFDQKLHTRVFITKAALPTYETKELGLTEEKFKIEPDMSLSIVITANEQADYMKVVGKALTLIHPEYENKMLHITHGMMRLLTGKISSRKGNAITGESLIRDTIALVGERLNERDWDEEEKNKVAEIVGVAALKYSILKQRTAGDIIFDFEKSVSFEGDSGPYLQYSYARANSVLSKAKQEDILPDFEILPDEIFDIERLLYKFPEIVLRSQSIYEPHYIANYLIEIARSFNSFYANTVIAKKDDPASPYKIALTFAFAMVMKKGLHLLGIKVPQKM